MGLGPMTGRAAGSAVFGRLPFFRIRSGPMTGRAAGNCAGNAIQTQLDALKHLK